MRYTHTIIAIFLCSTIQAQFVEVGVFGGVSNYQGDLAPVVFVPKETHLAYGGFTKYNFNKYLSLKASFYRGEISGNDLNSNNDWKLRRNLSFKSNINELSIFGELNVFGLQPHYRKKLFSPYIFGGVGVFTFNPKACYEGVWYDLQPLGTEGQGTNYYADRKPYKLTQLSIPLGIGFKASITEHLNVGIEMGWRKTFTDYLDDVSSTYADKDVLISENGEISWELSNRMDESSIGAPTGYLPGDNKFRGDPTDLDWYIFSGIIMSYNFGLLGWDTKKTKFHDSGGAKYNGIKSSRRKMGCPAINLKTH